LDTPGSLSAVGLSRDGTKLVVAESLGVKLFSTANGESLRQLSLPDGFLTPYKTCVFSPVDDSLAIGSEQGDLSLLLKLFSAGQDRPKVATLNQRTHRGLDIDDLCFTADGNTLIAVHGAGFRTEDQPEIRFWDVKNLNRGTAIDVKQGGWIAYSASGGFVAAQDDDVVIVIDVNSARELSRITGKRTTCGAASANGDLVVTGNYDGDVTVYKVVNHRLQEFGAVRPHEGAVSSLAFTPDGTSIISAGFDGYIRMISVK
jgi:WD40 repeat protein